MSASKEASKKPTTSTKRSNEDAWLDAELAKLTKETKAPRPATAGKNARKAGHSTSSKDAPKGVREDLDPRRRADQRRPTSSSAHKQPATEQLSQSEEQQRKDDTRDEPLPHPIEPSRSVDVPGPSAKKVEVKDESPSRVEQAPIKPRGPPAAPQQPDTPIALGEDFDEEMPYEPATPVAYSSIDIADDTQHNGSDDNIDGAYEEDFEEYAEDFEDFENFEEENDDLPEPAFHPPLVHSVPFTDITEVQRALEAENERASSRQEQRTKEEGYEMKPERTSSALPQRKIIGLESARKEAQRAKRLSETERRQTQRAKDLGNLISLDVCYYDIFDLHPMNEYELYIRNFGSSNAVQASTQSNEDLVQQEVQTDNYDTDNKWVQAPPDQFIDCGRGNPLTYSQQQLWKDINQTDATAKIDSVRLSSFLRRAGQVIDILLEENTADMGMPRAFNASSSMSISQGYVELRRLTFLTGRKIRCTSYSSMDYRLMLVAYSPVPTGIENEFLRDMGILCLWRLTDPSTPYRVLVCESDPTSCCFAPTKPNLVFAGTADGSVLAWDIQEPPSSHKKMSLDAEETIVRYPSYSTDGLYTVKRAHEEPIRKLVALHQYRDIEQGNRHFMLGLSGVDQGSFQLASVDLAGTVQLWAVIELRDESFAHSEQDFGMAFGSRIKLVRSTGFKLSLPGRQKATTDLLVLDCAFYPNDVDRFIVGTDADTILHESRFRNPCYPRMYRMRESNITRIVGVTSVDFCPHEHRLFLAGYTSGVVGLFTLKVEKPMMSWEISKEPIQLVRWSPHRPAVFYVLDYVGTLTIWDLSESEARPAHTVIREMNRSGRGEGKAMATFALSPTMVSAMSSASNANLTAASNRTATILFGYTDGSAEVHLLDQNLTEKAVDEEGALAAYIDGNGMKQDEGANSYDDDYE